MSGERAKREEEWESDLIINGEHIRREREGILSVRPARKRRILEGKW